MAAVTFLTGASSGLGWALAPLIAKEGHAVALVARRTDRLEELAGRIQAAGGRALAITADVGDRQAVHAAVQRASKALGPIDRLIANAGVGEPTPAEGFDATQVEWILRVNLLGVAYCVEAILPGMLERGAGHLVAVSSLAGYRGLPGSAAYCASKAGLTAMMESLRIELKPRNIAVTTLCPGFVKTAMTERNAHPMPFLLDLEDAARRMHRAIVKRKTQHAFPWPLAFTVRAGRAVPNALYDRFLQNQSAARRREEP